MNRGSPRRNARVLGDEAVATLAVLDVLDLDLAGNVQLAPRFVRDVKRALRLARHGSEEHVDTEARLLPALQRVIEIRAAEHDAHVDVETLSETLHARYPVEWRLVLDGAR